MAGLICAGSVGAVWSTMAVPAPRGGLPAAWVDVQAPLLFLVVTPIAVACVRSLGARAAALLAPATATAAGEAALEHALHPQSALVMGVLVLAVLSLAPLAAAVAICGRLSPRPGGQRKPGVDAVLAAWPSECRLGAIPAGGNRDG